MTTSRLRSPPFVDVEDETITGDKDLDRDAGSLPRQVRINTYNFHKLETRNFVSDIKNELKN